MLKYLAGLVVRSLVELAIVLLVFAGLLFAIAYRAARLFATPEPDKLDRFAGQLSSVLGLVANRRRAAASLPSDEPEPDLEWPAWAPPVPDDDDPGVEQADAAGRFDWREQAI